MPDSTGQRTGGTSNPQDSTLEDLNELYRQLKGPREVYEPDWYLNVAYFNGDQWVMWNGGRIDRPQLEPWRITVVDNRILPVATSRLARKTKNRPVFSVTPNTESEKDLNAAELSKRVLENDWEQQNLQIKLAQAMGWAEICSAGFWKVYWDKTKGEGGTEYVVGQDSQPYLHPDSQRPVTADSETGAALLGSNGDYSSQAVNMGDACVDVLSPFNLYPDPLAEEIEECEIIIEENVRSVEWVKKYYGETVEPDTDAPAGVAESRMFPYITNTASQGGSNYRGVTVRELYAKPGSKYGEYGKRCVWIKDKLLIEQDLQESPFEGCPYVMFPGIRVPGRFWPTSVTTQLRGPQTDLNKALSQIRENATRLGNPSIMMSRQAQVKYTGVPGEKIWYDSTITDAAPSYLQPPEMPVYVQNEIERIENSIVEISGLHEISKGNVPSGVTAASAINLLQEADDTRLGPEIQDMELAVGEAGEKLLKLRSKFQTDERFIRMAGEDGDWNIASYRGTMSRDNTSVEVQAGSMLMRSTAAKQAAMMELLQQMFQYGVEIKPRDLRKFLREYGVGGLDSIFEGLTDDEQQIKREHMLMRQGQAIDINSYDDDDLHIEGHQQHMKTRQYWEYPDMVKQIFELHVQAHMERRQGAVDAQVAEQQQEATQAMNGAGSGTTQTVR